MPDDTNYIQGTTDEEQRRLSLMNRLINAACLKEMPLTTGDRVLDVGCGLAEYTRMMARTVGPTGAVLGVERAEEQLRTARRLAEEAGEGDRLPLRQFTLRQGDARALPLAEAEWGSFDVAHARFVLEHVADPLAVVRQMARAVRPGGRLVLVDDDHAVFRLWPEPPGFTTLWQAYLRTYDRLGNDAFVGRRLVALLHAAGAQPLRNTWIFYGGCAGQVTFDAYVANLIGVLAGARSAILAHDFVSPDHFDTTLDAFDAWRTRPDAAFWYALCHAEGSR